MPVMPNSITKEVKKTPYVTQGQHWKTFIFEDCVPLTMTTNRVEGTYTTTENQLINA